jgi:hypothetical protein
MHAHHVRESLGRAGFGRGDHGHRLPLVFTNAVGETVDGGDGLRSRGQSKNAEMQNSAGPKYRFSFLASILSAFILGKIIYHLAISTALYGMKVGFAVWLPFVMTVQLTDKLFTNRPISFS